jgi:hypothetical protein
MSFAARLTAGGQSRDPCRANPETEETKCIVERVVKETEELVEQTRRALDLSRQALARASERAYLAPADEHSQEARC